MTAEINLRQEPPTQTMSCPETALFEIAEEMKEQGLFIIKIVEHALKVSDSLNRKSKSRKQLYKNGYRLSLIKPTSEKKKMFAKIYSNKLLAAKRSQKLTSHTKIF